MLAVVCQMPPDEERRIGLALEAVHRVRLLRASPLDCIDDGRISAVERNIEFALLAKAMSPIPSRLVPAVGYVEAEAVVSMLASGTHGSPQILRQLVHELPVRRDDEPASLDTIPVSVTVAVEEARHHFLGGGDNSREL